ncbi:peptide/nickel transport system permease protein [Cupriavidus gilardii J11]|uniref:Peptide/nickel transport system permease protein n=1 Tax=Cupriavidus gilardii J11 TaxID=936133 RepID=A0A562BQT8_9BURK|nr:ABC transporter permease subunit [Cupriavidus gilardii]TWG87541.1 peptide/nickel transport system permease protein [Cupriavidus gilardii J11]
MMVRGSATRARVIAIVLLMALLALAVAGPVLSPRAPFEQNLYAILQPPSLAEPLGTDHLGRSLFARVAAATRLSLGLAILCVLSAAVPGTLLGLLAAWRGGWAERLLSALADVVLALPGLLLVLLLAALAPGAMWPLYLGLSLVLWVEYFRVVRARAAVVLAGPQVEAARLLGFGAGYIAWRHLLPELAPVLRTLTSFGVGAAVLALAAMGFVGMGAQPPAAELGLMMTELLPYAAEAPWAIGAPVAVLACAMLALVLLGERVNGEAQ